MSSTATVTAPNNYLDGMNNVSFTLSRHIDRQQYDRALLKDNSGRGRRYRRIMFKRDPLMFAVWYMAAVLATNQTGERLSFSDAHLDLYRHALSWIGQKDFAEHRHAWFLPRNAGKSTMLFKILPLWALVYGHRKFMVAFGGSQHEAQKHLDFLRTAFATNAKLRRDWTLPSAEGLIECVLDPVKIAGRGLTVDLALKNGARVSAAGIDSQSLGTTTETAYRPDLILFDDIEKGEGTYSIEQAKKRLTTMVDAVLPMAGDAVVEYVGTVTMGGGIADQLLTAAVRGGGDARELAWVRNENFTVHLYEPIVYDVELGCERSFWEEMWSYVTLRKLRARGGKSWFKNFMNIAVSDDSLWFTPDDFRYAQLREMEFDLVVASVDPAVADPKKKKDRTGIVVAGFNTRSGVVYPLATVAGRYEPDQLRTVLLRLQARWRFQALIWETNQGGHALMNAILERDGRNILGLPRSRVWPVQQGTNTGFKESSYPIASKLARFERLQRDITASPGVIYFLGEPLAGVSQLDSRVVELEKELLSFGGSSTGTRDVIDAFATLVWFLRHKPRQPTNSPTASYGLTGRKL